MKKILRKQIIIPDKKRIFRFGIEAGKIYKVHVPHIPSEQDFVPTDRKLIEKLGLKKGEKVLVFAGGHGDWANALARKKMKVFYTDASKKMTSYAEKRFSKSKISSFRAREASLQPQLKKKFDWSFSFEPVPLEPSWNLTFALLRSLLNKKGAKFVYRERDDPFGPKINKEFEKIYGIKIRTKLELLFGIRHGKKQLKECNIITIKTNNEARKKVNIDLKVMNFLRKRKVLNTKDVRKMIKIFKISEKELQESIRRIKNLTEKVKPRVGMLSVVSLPKILG